MKDVSGHDSALQDYTGPFKTWANEMNYIMIIPLVQDRLLDPVDLFHHLWIV